MNSSNIKKAIKKAKKIATDSQLNEILKDIAEVEKAAKEVSQSSSDRFRTPYIDALPIGNACWTR